MVCGGGVGVGVCVCGVCVCYGGWGRVGVRGAVQCRRMASSLMSIVLRSGDHALPPPVG